MSRDENKVRRVGLKPFAEIIEEMSDGDVEKQLTNQLAEVVRACEATKKKGKLTVTFHIVPGPKMMAMAVDIKATIPKPAIESQQFFVDDKGGLHIENPRQTAMPFSSGPKSVTTPDNNDNGGD